MAKRRRLTQDKLIQLRDRMIKHASINGHPHPEDIASQYVIRLLEGLHSKATVGQAYVDIHRSTNGRKGMPGYEAKQQLLYASNPAASAYLEDQTNLTVDECIALRQALGRIKKPKIRKLFDQLTDRVAFDFRSLWFEI